jgi:hypothetical protein
VTLLRALADSDTRTTPRQRVVIGLLVGLLASGIGPLVLAAAFMTVLGIAPG